MFILENDFNRRGGENRVQYVYYVSGEYQEYPGYERGGICASWCRQLSDLAQDWMVKPTLASMYYTAKKLKQIQKQIT